jgi:hypothetical protein
VKQVVHRLITTWADLLEGKKFNASLLIIVAYCRSAWTVESCEIRIKSGFFSIIQKENICS